MAEAAVTFLLENVQKLLLNHMNLVSGAAKELKQLQSDLALMKAFLEESAEWEKGHIIRQFERQIRGVVYEAEDTLDTCLTKAGAGKSRGFGLRNPDLAKKVKTLMEKEVRPTIERALTMANLPNTEKSKDKNRKAQFLREDNVVGIEEEADTLINYLNEEIEELEVISIIGMPGIGKTTLARKIYLDPRIRDKFSFLIWVYVSQEFNMKEVFLTILRSFTQDDLSHMTDPELAKKVRSYLENSNFLLFIDDVWTGDAWESIEMALPRSNRLGKVMITSRDEKIAWQANREREPHRLRFLDPDRSWELLQLEVFGKLEMCPPDLKELGRRIATQCGGVPLAIVVIGGILVEKFSTSIYMKGEWEKISTSVSAYLKYDKQKRTESIISLSYNELARDLRQCFLYLGMFPGNTEIPAWRLIRLWVAEGFIKQKPEKSLEEVAEDNLKDLADRNLVIVDKTRTKGDVKTFRVHDMIREFCQTEAAEQNLFQEVEKSREGVLHPPFSEIPNHRRLCIHSCVADFLRKNPKVPGVRSFLCFAKEAVILPQECIRLIPEAFSLLRVLDANPIKFTEFPTKLTQLIHLRYIVLSGDDNFRALPENFSKLWNLQTIRIDTMSPTFEIKADLWKLMHLRHLKTKAAIILNKEMKGQAGEHLQTLSRLSTQCCNEDVFNKASNLKNLGIRGQLGTLSQARCLENLDLLQKLKLVHDVFPQKPLRGLPHHKRFPPNLKILKLSSTFLDWSNMITLGMLPNLEVLKLKENAFRGSTWDAVAGCFPSLEFLYIAGTDLEFWTTSGDAFPKLRCLVIKNCDKLERIPFVLEKSLQILDIECVTKSLVASARKIEGKQQMQCEQRGRRGRFKLMISPGDE